MENVQRIPGSEEIRAFLDDVKECIRCNNFQVIPRQKNRDGLSDIGLTRKQRNDVILGLSVIDYVKGPDFDRDQRGNVWIFGKNIGEIEVYIKLKTVKIGEEKFAKCISFHIAEYEMSYPFE